MSEKLKQFGIIGIFLGFIVFFTSVAFAENDEFVINRSMHGADVSEQDIKDLMYCINERQNSPSDGCKRNKPTDVYNEL